LKRKENREYENFMFVYNLKKRNCKNIRERIIELTKENEKR
jgi:hypothetical protein